jgi:hypothetical protein
VTDEVLGRAAAGDRDALRELPGLLVTHGLFDELRDRADGGDLPSARLWIKLLDRTEDLRAWTSHPQGAAALSRLLAKHARLDEVRTLARTGHLPAVNDSTIPDLRSRASLLAKQGLDDELRQRLAGGDSRAHNELVNLLLRLGREHDLAALADAGDDTAGRRLDHLLHTQGRVDDLRARAEAGDSCAASFLGATFTDDDTLRSRGLLDRAPRRPGRRPARVRRPHGSRRLPPRRSPSARSHRPIGCRKLSDLLRLATVEPCG